MTLARDSRSRAFAKSRNQEIEFSSRKEILHFVEHALRVRRLLALEFRELLEKVALLGAERLRNAQLDVHVVIAAAAAVDERNAFAAQAEDLVRLRTCGNLQLLFAVNGFRH